MTWWDWPQRWLDIALGGGIGTAAKYGLLVSEGRVITWRWVVGDLLLLGFVLLVARLIADWLKLDREAATMCGALCALCSFKMVQIIRVRFLKKVDDTLAGTLKQARGEMRQNIQIEASGERLVSDLAEGRSDVPSTIYRKPGKPPEG